MIDRFDHLVLTVRDLAATRRFYVHGLGLREDTGADGRFALHFGQQKLNLHEAGGAPILPRADRPTPGSADFCLIANRPIGEIEELLSHRGLAIELGPVERQGACGLMRSLYLRDPDANLVEISVYVDRTV